MSGFEAFLINPPKKRRKSSRRRKPKMARRTRDSRGRFTRRRAAAHNPRRRRRVHSRRRRTYRRNPGVAELMLMNPPRKRRSRRTRRHSMRRRFSRVRRYASKSLIPSMKGIMGTVQEGAFLAAGAVNRTGVLPSGSGHPENGSAEASGSACRGGCRRASHRAVRFPETRAGVHPRRRGDNAHDRGE